MGMETLDQLGLKYGTDKASNEHDYCVIYERYIKDLWKRNVSIIEIGVGGYEYEDRGGQSLKMWYDYFPNGKIIGIDLNNKINIVNDRTEFWQGSQIDHNLFKIILEREKDAEVRIVIDDASHNNKLTIKSFEIVFPLLKSGDFYIVEDVHTSYFNDEEYGGNSNPFNECDPYWLPTSMQYFSRLTHQLNNKHLKTEHIIREFLDIEFIHFYKEVIIIKKK